MMNFICGPNGSGKTQKLITLANEELENTNGLIVYIDKYDKHRLSVDNRIRFINAKEFDLGCVNKFFGFICGLIAGNYDINRIYIDNIISIAKVEDCATLQKLFKDIALLSQQHGVKFCFTINDTDFSAEDIKNFNYSLA